MARVLSIDPSGTGTTGLFFANGSEQFFTEIKSKSWKEHYAFIKDKVTELKPTLLIYEDTNYIHRKTKDGLSLFRLLGAIESLAVKEIRSINVLKVKEISKKLLNNAYQIKNLEYLKGRGKGWMYQNKRVSIHQLEAFIVYYLFIKKV